ncbi:flagellar export chaperone FliS [Heyndrickxia oleronia]|uniref:flagellar export chaperone FliS n=1 Tax=Heyndrickxia oleronia TaxID=38875 RepID=UPI001C0EB928|nr:flagellar export chaperone FliS [Heyndrickxia oleronia]MBU5212187.1 flagellar export chaperone FliS [Heyndrickxia oleronia]
MSINNPYQTYKNNTTVTASPGELTLMLYDGCIKFVNHAKKAIENKNIGDKNLYIQKSQNIIQELMVTLKMEYPISKNMMSLYDYINRRLIEANIKSDVSILEEVEELVTEFRDTWKQVIRLNRQKKYASNDGQA